MSNRLFLLTLKDIGQGKVKGGQCKNNCMHNRNLTKQQILTKLGKYIIRRGLILLIFEARSKVSQVNGHFETVISTSDSKLQIINKLGTLANIIARRKG